MGTKIEIDPNIQDQENSCNENVRESRIKRSPHDKQNPYSMTNLDLIRDETLSPHCRWLLIYLLSNTDTWEIRVQQVINHLKPHMGRDKVRRLFAEAVTAGYMERLTVLISLESGGKLKRFDYHVSESPSFKKCYRCTENQGPDNQDADDQSTGDRPLSNNKREEEPIERNNNITPTPQPPDPEPPPDVVVVPPSKNNGKTYENISDEERALVDQCLARPKTPIDNIGGLRATCLKEGWHLKDQFDPPPPPEPESMVNKRENTKYAEHVIKKLECVQEIDTGLTSDHLRVMHTGSGSHLLNLAEGTYEFRKRLYQILRQLGISPELYLKEDVTPRRINDEKEGRHPDQGEEKTGEGGEEGEGA